MAEHAEPSCHCGPCLCDGTVSRQFEQTSGRYNDRSAFAGNLQQDSVVQLQSQFQAQAQKQLEDNPSDRLLTQMASLVALIRAGGAPG